MHGSLTRTLWASPSSRAMASGRSIVSVAVGLALAGFIGPSPASAAQSFDQTRAASIGVSEDGTSRPTGFGMPGECVESVRRWIEGAGGRLASGSGPYQNYVNSPANLIATGTSSTVEQARRGDVIQYTYDANRDLWADGIHTVLVVDNNGDGTLRIVQSNVPAGSGRVSVDDRWRPAPPVGFTPYLWRLGQVPEPPATVGGRAFTVDGSGRVWIAAVKADGSLYYQHTSSGPNGWDGFSQLGAAGSWSPQSSPAFTVDGAGRVWIAAVKRDGSLYYQHTSSGPNGWDGFSQLGAAGSWSPQSSPAFTVDGAGRVWIAAVKRDGSLYYQHTSSGPNGWDGFSQLGAAGSWSPQSSPAFTVDGAGRVWIAAVKRDGSLYYQHTSSGPNGWDGFSQLGAAGSWSPQSSPAFTVDGAGRVWIAAVKRDGSLYYQHTSSGPNGWDGFSQLGAAGSWSPQSSPAFTVDGAGRVWIAAVKRDGSLYYQHTSSGPNGWDGFSQLGAAGSWSPQSSPAFTVDGAGRVWIAAVKRDGSLYYQHTSSGPNGWDGFSQLW